LRKFSLFIGFPFCGVELVIVFEFLVEPGAVFLHLAGLFEKSLGRDGKKLGGVGRAVRVENRMTAGVNSVAKFFVFGAEDSGPGLVRRRTIQKRGAIDSAVFLVKLMGKLVQDDVVFILYVAGGAGDTVPGEHDRAVPPGLAETDVFAFDNQAVVMVYAVNDVGVGIDIDCAESRVEFCRAVEQEHTGLGGDGNFDRVGDLLAAAADEGFFVEEEMDEAVELGFQVLRKMAIEGDIFFEQAPPGVGERLEAKVPTPFDAEDSFGRHGENQNGSHRRNDIACPLCGVCHTVVP